jgi:hypothetical protein
MSQETYARFIVTSNVYSAEQISGKIGLKPHRTWKKGDLRPNTQIAEPSNGWLINSPVGKDQPLRLHVERLLAILSPHAKEIAGLTPACDSELSCVYYGESRPEVNFESTIIQGLSKLDCSLDIDIYIT